MSTETFDKVFKNSVQYWQYQEGQKKSACHFHTKKLTVTLLVKCYRGVIGECILTIEMSYKVIWGTLKYNLCKKSETKIW